MAQFFHVHPVNPQPRLIHRAVEIIREGGVIVYLTDTSYALGCHTGDKAALDRIRSIRRLTADHNFTLVARSVSEVSQLVKITNEQYRLLRAHTPGPYTFILPATRIVPRRLKHPRRKTIGLRIPDSVLVSALLDQLGEPLMSTTLILPDDNLPLSDPEIIRERLEHSVDLIVDSGAGHLEPSSVIDLVGEMPTVVREGMGDVSVFVEHGSH